MALKAGRVGVAPDQVDEFGKINSDATQGYTKQEADAKFETKTNAASTYETKSDAANLQPKTLSVPISMLHGSVLTVEQGFSGLAGALTNKELTDQKVSYSDNGVLGAKNLFPLSLENYASDLNASHTYNDHEFVITTVSGNTSAGIYWSANSVLKPYFIGKGYSFKAILSFDVKGGDSFLTNCGEEAHNLPITVTTQYKHYEMDIDDLTQMTSLIFYVKDAAASHVLYVKNIMLRMYGDKDNTYQPYAMTNQDLSKAVTAVDAKIYCNWLPNSESVTVGEQVYNGGIVYVWKGSDYGIYCFDRTSNVCTIKALDGITVTSNGYNNLVTNVTITNSKGEGVFVAVISGK